MNNRKKICLSIVTILIISYGFFIDKFYEINNTVKTFDIFTGMAGTLFILLVFIEVQHHTVSKRSYHFFNSGIILLLFSHFSGLLCKMYEYPEVLRQISYDFIEVISFILIFIGIHFTMQENDLNISKLKKLASTDDLTNVFNRYEMINRFNLLKKISDRNDNPLSVIYFDIDHFKKINDTYGHSMGDSVLKELSSLISCNLREQDIFGRHGGDEFLIILPETDLKGAVTLAEKLCDKTEHFKFKKISKLTISCGVAQHKKLEAIEKTIKRSDEALYLSKRKGRNCVSSEQDEKPFEVPDPI